MPQQEDLTIEILDKLISVEDDIESVCFEIRNLELKDALRYLMKWKDISESKLVQLCEGVLSERTVQRILEEKGKTKSQRKSLILICIALKLPYRIARVLIQKAGYSLDDGIVGRRIQQLLKQKNVNLRVAQRVLQRINLQKKSA